MGCIGRYIGGEAGIRTLGGLPLNGFQDRRFRPLSHLSCAAQEYRKQDHHCQYFPQKTTVFRLLFLSRVFILE